MEPLQSKQPRTRSRWTIVRGTKYAAGVIILILATLACVVWFDLAPAQFDQNSGIFIEQEEFAYDAFDAFDIVEYERPSGEIKISVGEYVVMRSSGNVLYTAKVWVGPIGEPCTEEAIKDVPQPHDNFFCDHIQWVFRYSLLIPGALDPQIISPGGKKAWFDGVVEPFGVRPNKVGNLHEYSFINDEITHAFGSVLFNIYKWTGLNLFGLSK